MMSTSLEWLGVKSGCVVEGDCSQSKVGECVANGSPA